MTYRELPNDETTRKIRAAFRDIVRAHRSSERSQNMSLAALRPRLCAACRLPLVSPLRGRPPSYCADPACRRRAAADRQARKRRRDQGLPLTLEVQAVGGRASLLDRTVRRRAREWFPSLTLDMDDVIALAVLVRNIDPSHSHTLHDVTEWLGANARSLRQPEALARLRGLIERERAAMSGVVKGALRLLPLTEGSQP